MCGTVLGGGSTEEKDGLDPLQGPWLRKGRQEGFTSVSW